MSAEATRRARADARRTRVTLHRGTLQEGERDLSPVRGAEALALVTRLSQEAWSLGGRSLPTYARNSIPCRFIPGRLT